MVSAEIKFLAREKKELVRPIVIMNVANGEARASA